MCVLINFTPSFRVFPIAFALPDQFFGDSQFFRAIVFHWWESKEQANKAAVAPNGRRKQIKWKNKNSSESDRLFLNKRSPCIGWVSLTHSTDSAQVRFLSTWWSPTLVLLWFFYWPLPRFLPSLRKIWLLSLLALSHFFFFFCWTIERDESHSNTPGVVSKTGRNEWKES